MANIASARKRARQALKLREHNMSLRTAARSAIKEVRKAIASGNKAAAEEALKKSRPIIDRVSAKGVLHSNAASRHKKRLAHAIKSLP